MTRACAVRVQQVIVAFSRRTKTKTNQNFIASHPLQLLKVIFLAKESSPFISPHKAGRAVGATARTA
jgi:hypothetical protein